MSCRLSKVPRQGPHLAAGAAADTHRGWACAGGGGPLTVYIYELSLCTSEGISEVTVNLVSFLLWGFCSGAFSCLCVLCCVGAFPYSSRLSVVRYWSSLSRSLTGPVLLCSQGEFRRQELWPWG